MRPVWSRPSWMYRGGAVCVGDPSIGTTAGNAGCGEAGGVVEPGAGERGITRGADWAGSMIGGVVGKSGRPGLGGVGTWPAWFGAGTVVVVAGTAIVFRGGGGTIDPGFALVPGGCALTTPACPIAARANRRPSLNTRFRRTGPPRV